MQREHGLVRVERKLVLDVAVANRVSVTVEESLERLVELEARECKAVADAERHAELGVRLPRQVDPCREWGKLQRRPVSVTELDDPGASADPRREPQLHGASVERRRQ